MYYILVPFKKEDGIVYRKVASTYTKILANQMADGISIKYNIERSWIWIATDEDLKDITIDV